MIDESWLDQRLAAHTSREDPDGAVDRLRSALEAYAERFNEMREDVASATVIWPRRGLLPDEASSFLHALDAGLIDVDDGGYVTPPTVRPKAPAGWYALLSKSGHGVSVNLEYLIQIGATAELVIDLGWPSESIDFERGEFDALGWHDSCVVLAMEAKARVTGPDSLDTLVRFWLRAIGDPAVDLDNNSGRKLRELDRLCAAGPILVWLVAEGARWSLWAAKDETGLVLRPGPAPDLPTVQSLLARGRPMRESFPHNQRLHRSTTAAGQGHCSWHGPASCPDTPVISFQDAQGRWQSGCERALDELTARGDISPPT